MNSPKGVRGQGGCLRVGVASFKCFHVVHGPACVVQCTYHQDMSLFPWVAYAEAHASHLFAQPLLQIA